MNLKYIIEICIGIDIAIIGIAYPIIIDKISNKPLLLNKLSISASIKLSSFFLGFVKPMLWTYNPITARILTTMMLKYSINGCYLMKGKGLLVNISITIFLCFDLIYLIMRSASNVIL